MALVGTDLGDAVWAAVKAKTGAAYSAQQDADGKAMWETIGTAIVAYLTTNAVITPSTLAITPGSLIAPSGGGAVSGNGSVNVGTGKLT